MHYTEHNTGLWCVDTEIGVYSKAFYYRDAMPHYNNIKEITENVYTLPKSLICITWSFFCVYLFSLSLLYLKFTDYETMMMMMMMMMMTTTTTATVIVTSPELDFNTFKRKSDTVNLTSDPVKLCFFYFAWILPNLSHKRFFYISAVRFTYMYLHQVDCCVCMVYSFSVLPPASIMAPET